MKPLVVIAGPTGVGKTELSLKLAKAIGGEIISADSMQIYKELNIGTAKIRQDEMQGIKHHMIDILKPDKSYDVNTYKESVIKIIDDILTDNHIPILVGGTGFYIQAVTKDIDFTEEDNTSIREELTEFYEKFGEDALFERLKAIDSESAEIIPKQNIKRVIRAIEFYEIHNIKISDHNKNESLKESPYNLAFFVLTRNRDELYDNINKRVDLMMEEGLLSEVSSLTDKYTYNSQSGFQNAIGYKELIDYIKGNEPLEEAIENIKKNSRHYAKKQVTFFKREKEAIWFNKSEMNESLILENILKILKDKKIYE